MAIMSRNVLLLIGLLAATVGGCGETPPSDPDPTPLPSDSKPRMSGGWPVPVELTEPLRKDAGSRAETIVAVPTIFILSYRCDPRGRHSLYLTPYPPVASITVRIEAGSRTVAKGMTASRRIAGPFLSGQYQSVNVKQLTEARTYEANVGVEFKQGQCGVAGVNLTSREGDTYHSTASTTASGPGPWT